MTTIRFTSNGSITCKKCSTRVEIVDPLAIFLWEAPAWMKFEADDGEVLHRCGRRLSWWCPRCKQSYVIVTMASRRSGRGRMPSCRTCRFPMVQRVV